MKQHRSLLLMISAGILIPALIAVGAGWYFFAHEPDKDEALAVAPMTEAFLRATVREYAALSRELSHIDDVGIRGLLQSSAELAFLVRFDGAGNRRAIATNGESIERLDATWAVKRPCFGYSAAGTPIVVTPLPNTGWIVAGLDLDAIKRTWGLPRSLELRPIEPRDKPSQVVRLKGYTLPGQGPWSSEIRKPKTAGAPTYFTLTTIAMAILILCLVLTTWLSRRIQRTRDEEYQRTLGAWEAASDKPVNREHTANFRTLMGNITNEYRAIRESNNQLQNDKTKLEHALKEASAHGDGLERKLAKAQSAKDYADQAHAALRDQYRSLEERLSHTKLVSGDTWFAAVMREALERREAIDGDAARELLGNVSDLADLSKRGLKSALQVVNIGDRIKERAERCAEEQPKVLVSPFATNVYANPAAIDMLLDRLFDTIAANSDGEITMRVMRHRSVGGEERVRLALERTGSLRQDLDIAYHGVAALAGATIRPEKFNDERSALVLYFDAIQSDEEPTSRDLEPEAITAPQREKVRMLAGTPARRRSARVG